MPLHGGPPPPDGLEDGGLEDDSELAQKLGNRSPEEIYGDDEGTGAQRAPSSATLARPRLTARDEATRGEDEDFDPEGEPERSGSPEATRAGPPMRLEITGGPDEGTFKRFRGARMVVGRVKGCDLVLSDQSVSRRHLEFVLGASGVLLRDLGSGNGTKVNGERVTERKMLHGDVVALGQTKLKFVDETEAFRLAREQAEQEERAAKVSPEAASPEAPDKASASHPTAKSVVSGGSLTAAPSVAGDGPPAPGASLRQRWRSAPPGLRRGLVGGAALLFALLLFWTFHNTSLTAEEVRHSTAQQQLNLAKAALAEGRYQDAADITAFLQKSDPSFDLHGFNRTLQLETRAKVSLDLAEGLLAQKRFDDARAELARTPEASDGANARHAQLLKTLASAQTEFQIHSADEALSRRDFAEAERLVASLPVDLRPDFLVRLSKEKERAAKDQTEDVKRKETAAQQRKRREAASRRAFIDDAFGQVSRRMGEGDFTRAALECDRVADRFGKDEELRVKANAVKRLMPLLARDVADAKMKLDARAYEPAVRALRHGRDILTRDMDLTSPVGSKMDEMMSTALVGTSKSALAQDDWGAAAKQLREAAQLNPTNAGAREGLEKLAVQAEQLLQEALGGHEPDPQLVAAKLKLVMELSPRGSSTYAKARKALAGPNL